MVLVSIEFLVVMALIFVFLIWIILHFITKKLNQWRYKPENDLARKAEEKRRSGRASGRFTGRDNRHGTIEDSEFSVAGSSELENSGSLSKTDVNTDGKTSNSTGKTRRQFRSPFGRKRR